MTRFLVMFSLSAALVGGFDWPGTALAAGTDTTSPTTAPVNLAAQAVLDPAAIIPGVDPTDIEISAADCDSFPVGSGETYIENSVCGITLRFGFSWPEGTDGLTRLKEILGGHGGEILYAGEDGVAAQRQVSEGLTLWTRIWPRGEDSSAAAVLQAVLNPERDLVFSMDREDWEEVIFYTEHPGDRLMRLDVNAPDADVSLEGEYTQKVGELWRSVSQSEDLYRVHGPLHEAGRVPQYAGRTKWTLRLFDGAEQLDATLHWAAGPPIQPIAAGDGIGGIRLRNVPYGRASVVPEFEDSIEHPGFGEAAMEGDRTPLGETIFWLPPGYWTLIVAPESRDEDQQGLTQLESHMVPVQPGHITEVDWPPSLARAFGGEDAGRVEILDARADTETGKVDIALLDADRLGIVATKDNVRIHEAGANARVLSVERLATPPDVLLLLDSSGSMKNQMSQALDSASHFIRGLPEDAGITAIDFDTRPKRIEAASREALLAALARVRADGATALYDSILLALDELRAKTRPALVIFTDGVDANLNDTGPGSKATKEETLQAVEDAGIPVFTIGLGENSDVDTLQRIATLSGGAYYAAAAPEDLDPIFEQIRKNLGNAYRIRFERPARPRLGSVPVVSLVVDNSGSMDSDPETPGSGYRIEKVRQTLRRFVRDLPADFLLQLLTFTDEVGVRQVLTTDRAQLVRALSLMTGEGGTDTLGAVQAALNSLRAVPSSRRFLVFLTDAALDVDEERVKTFETLLGVIRDADIRSLWLGIVGSDQEAVFERAARLSGGRYVIAEDLDQVARTFQELAREMASQQEPSQLAPLRVEIRHHSETGVNATLVVSRDVDFPPAKVADVETSPEAVTQVVGPRLMPYDAELAAEVTGSDMAGRDVLVTKRIPLDYASGNSAMRIQFREAVFLSRLRGIDAPDGYRILALTLNVENILPAQKVAILPDGSNHPASWVAGDTRPVRYENRVPTYLIPDLRRHCFLRWNNARSYPVSEVTWLLENPLMVPGQTALAVEPGQPVQGALGFLVPASAADAASFQCYDTAYGHMAAPLWGEVRQAEPVPVETLPQVPPTRLSETFTFRVTGYSDRDRIQQVDAQEDAVFRVVKGELTSRVQAHLRLDPAERIRLLVQDDEGVRLFRLHPVTDRLPLGYWRPTLFPAGAKSPVELVFRMPRRLVEEQRPMALLFDIAGGSVTVPLAGSLTGPEPAGPPAAGNQDVEIFVHRAGRVVDVPEMGDNTVAVDATFRVPPGMGHLRLGQLLVLKGSGFDPAQADREMARAEELRQLPTPWDHRGLTSFAKTYLPPRPDELSATLLPEDAEYLLPMALDQDSLLPAGQARRGWVLFALPEDTTPEDWRLGSLIFDDLALPLSDEAMEEPLLRFTRLNVPDDGDEGFWELVAEKVQELSARRAASGWHKPGAVPLRVVDPDRGGETAPRLDPPGLTLAGARALADLESLQDLRRSATAIRWLPGDAPWTVRYAPEAVLTQGWGTGADLAALAERVLNRAGIRTQRAVAEVLDEGRQELARRAGLDEVEIDQLPALRYRDGDGTDRVLVLPFLEDLRALEGLVSYHLEALDEAPEAQAELEVGLLVRTVEEGRPRQVGGMADILAGGEAEDIEQAALISVDLDLASSSIDPVDVGFTRVPARGTVVYKAVLDGPTGRQVTPDEEAPDVTTVEVLGWYYDLETPNGEYRRRFPLPADTGITDVFLTLGINLPDLPPPALAALDEARRKAREDAPVPPDALSGLRWYAHGMMGRFLGAQSAWERHASEELTLIQGRTSRARVLAVTVSKDNAGGPLQARIDLLNPFPQVHQAPDPRAETAFRILGGLAAAQFEAEALSPPGTGLWQIWRQSPPDTRLLFVAEDNRDAFLELLRARAYPERLVTYLQDTERYLLFPTSPGVVDGDVRWAWLEVDPETYDIRAVLDDATGGAIVESIIGNLYEQASSYLVGAFVGINASLWSVSAFSLELEDYDQIVQQAESFARNLGKNFSVGNDYVGLPVGGLPSGSVSLDRALSFSLDPSGVSFSNNMLGFGNGYQDGISYYFQNAR